jgi:hypothetical protein
MGRTVVLMVLIGIVFLSAIQAQFKISSNDKLSLNNGPKTEHAESVNSTIENFFGLAQNGQRSEWEKLLASNCYKDGVPKEYVNSWFSFLSCQKTKYTIIETSSPKTNQRIIHYFSRPDTNNKKTIVLVKEKGRWKIYHAGL